MIVTVLFVCCPKESAAPVAAGAVSFQVILFLSPKLSVPYGTVF